MLHWLRLLIRRVKISLNPAQILFLGYAAIIFFGAFLLCMPFSLNDGIEVSFIDTLFTAIASTCVTGLSTVSMATTWSLWGKLIILILIQIGGLGFITFYTFLFVFLGKKITLKERILIKSSLNQQSLQGMVKLVKTVIWGALLIEGCAAVVLTIRFMFLPDVDVPTAILWGIFHSVSAFCNAGIDIIGSDSLTRFVADPVINITVMVLIFSGGIGFTVWGDFIRVLHRRKENSSASYKYMMHLSLHTKIVLVVTFILISSGTILIFCADYSNPGTLAPLGTGEKILASFFQSITSRTTGFFTLDQQSLTYSSKLTTVILMFIGGSPGGAAGGVKTTTVGVIIVAILSVIRGNDSINIFKKRISLQILMQALTVMMMMLIMIITATMILSVTERGTPHEFMDLLVESTSAISTSGISLGITPYLSMAGKIILCVCMFVGRLGPITAVFALQVRLNKNTNAVLYPEERIIVG